MEGWYIKTCSSKVFDQLFYARSSIFIEQRLKQIEQQLQQAHNAVEQFEQEILSICAHNDDRFSTLKKLSSIVH